MQGLNMCMQHDNHEVFALMHWTLFNGSCMTKTEHSKSGMTCVRSDCQCLQAWVGEAAFALPDEIFRLGITVLTNVADLCNRSEYLAGCQYIFFSNNACMDMQMDRQAMLNAHVAVSLPATAARPRCRAAARTTSIPQGICLQDDFS